MKEYEIDTDKLPLGKMSKKQIQTGHVILKKIQDNLKNFNKDDFIELSSKFWSNIPYSCGHRGTPPIIRTKDDLEKYADMLENLSNIEVAGKIIEAANTDDVHPLDHIYDSLDISIDPLDKDDEQYELIEKYIKNTHACTHNYNLDEIDIFSLDKDTDDRNFNKIPNHRLLVHGSRMSNFISILSDGLRIPKSTQVMNGSVLGHGCYFADSISKSFNYCNAYDTNKIGFLLLCDVALGKLETIIQPTYDKPLEYKCQARFAQGGTEPEEDGSEILEYETHDCTVPCGKLGPCGNKANGSSFLYNEFVIYNKDQYRFRYLIKLKEC